MKSRSQDKSDTIKDKISYINSLIQKKEFKQALAEIRDLENRDEFSYSGEFLYLSAIVLQGIGNYQEALLKAKKAYGVFRNSAENKEIAQIQFITGIIQSDIGNLREAEFELRDALATYRRINDEQGIIETYNELARIYFVQGEYEKVINYLSQGLEYSNRINDSKMIARFSGNLGTTCMLTGRWKKAETHLLTSLKYDERNKNTINICCWYLSLGYVCFLQRDFTKTVEYYEKALKLIYDNNYMREMAIYYEYYGELAFTQGNYFLAEDHCRNGIKIGEEIAPAGDIVSQTYRLLAEVQIAEKQYDEALFSCEKALKVAESLGERIEIGAIHRALGQIYTAKKDTGKAKENFEKSISVLEEIGAKFELGKTYLVALKSDSFEYHDRVAYFANAREVFKELESDYWLGKTTIAFCEMLFETGEYEKAEVYLKEPENIFNQLNEEKELTSVLELKNKINRVLDKVGTHETNKRIEYHFSDIVTQHPQMLALLDEAGKLKDLDVPILIEGETGTGKDLLASVIHCESRRKNRRFVPVNCPAIPEHLLESELFGYKKGAFTGADKDKMGLFEAADGGTIFLNEIGDLPLRLQSRMLDVIEYKTFTRLGEVQVRRIDFRVIAATNKDLSEEIVKGNFREDLYHRLNVLKLKLPPLRERKNDIPLLIKHFLATQGISCEDLDKSIYLPDCLGCHWPGNVRQLKNELKRSVSLSNPFDLQKLLEELGKSNRTRAEVVAGNSLVGKKAEAERAEILEVIKKSDGDKEMAARFLGVSRATLYRKIKDYNLNI